MRCSTSCIHAVVSRKAGEGIFVCWQRPNDLVQYRSNNVAARGNDAKAEEGILKQSLK
jgi:hypothetical protein